MTMILAILIIAYKKINAIKEFKIAKLKFEIELENEIIKTIVTLCGGDPAKLHISLAQPESGFKHLWSGDLRPRRDSVMALSVEKCRKVK